MRKLVFMVLALMVTMQFAFADGNILSQQVYTVEINNDTPNPVTTAIPVTTIRPDIDKIVGFTVMHNGTGANQETFAALYDSTSTNTSGMEVLGENEATQNLSLTELYVHPRKVLEGVVVRQGARSIVLVQFIRE